MAAGPSVPASQPISASGSSNDASSQSGSRLLETPNRWSDFALGTTVLGGALIALNGLAVLLGFVETLDAAIALPAGSDVGIGLFGLIVGMAIAVAAAFAQSSTQAGRTARGVILALAVLSLVSGGGFLVGLSLATVGAILAGAIRPGPRYELAPADMKLCPSCGRLVRIDSPICPSCKIAFDRGGS